MGLLVPSIASPDLTLSEANRDVATTVAYYYSAGQKCKKINQQDMSTDDNNNNPDLNSFATSAFPHCSDKLSNIQSGESLKNNTHSPKSKFSLCQAKMKQVDIHCCNSCHDDDYSHENALFPQDFQSQSTE